MARNIVQVIDIGSHSIKALAAERKDSEGARAFKGIWFEKKI